MNLLDQYLPQTEFASYEAFIRDYRVTIPEDFNFAYDIVDRYAAQAPAQEALHWCDDEGHEEIFTFGRLAKRVNQAAHVYQSLGVGKGDRVLLLLRQRPEAWICMLAVHKLGGVVIPATSQLTDKDIAYRCDAAGVRVITCVDDPGLLEHVEKVRPACQSLEHVCVVGGHVPAGMLDFRALMDGQADAFPRAALAQDTRVTDPMLIYFSSGTTGMPKMILHDYSYPLGHIVTAKYWQQVREGGRHLTMGDSGWAKFGWGKIYGQWICGAIIVAYDEVGRFRPERLLALIDRVGLTTFCAPPTVYRFLIKENLAGHDFSTIAHCSTAGEPLNPEVYLQFQKATGLEIREGFGQSETSVILANFPWMEVKPGSSGRPSPLYDMDIVDEAGKTCEDGIVGRIVVRGTDIYKPPALVREYLGDTAANEAAWRDNMYDTGDLAWRDGDGYYWFEGRADDVIKCSGYRIGPFEVESALVSHPAVLECAVTAAPDPVRGQVVKATVVLAPGHAPQDALKKELQEHVKRVTAPYKYPRIVEFVDELPKTFSGKIRRKEIRQRDENKG